MDHTPNMECGQWASTPLHLTIRVQTFILHVGEKPVIRRSFAILECTTHDNDTRVAASPELEQTLVSLTSHRSVLEYMLLSRGQPVTMIRHSGVIFEGEKGKKYASAISCIVESVQAGLEDVSGDTSDVVRSPVLPRHRVLT